jgi:hypothetical protein
MPSTMMMSQLSVLEMRTEAPHQITPSPERKTVEVETQQSTMSARKQLFQQDDSVISRSKKRKKTKSRACSSTSSSTARKRPFIMRTVPQSDVSSLNPAPLQPLSAKRTSRRPRTSIRQRRQVIHLCLDSLASLTVSSSRTKTIEPPKKKPPRTNA